MGEMSDSAPFVGSFPTLIRKFRRDSSGATAVEYGIVAVGIGIAIVGAIDVVGTNLDAIFVDVSGMF